MPLVTSLKLHLHQGVALVPVIRKFIFVAPNKKQPKKDDTADKSHRRSVTATGSCKLAKEPVGLLVEQQPLGFT